MKFFINLAIALLFFSPVLFSQERELVNSGDLIDKGSVLSDSGEFKKALLLYDKISRSDTNYVRALLAKALACQADSQYDLSIKYCQQALAQQTQREFEPEIYNTYGNTLDNMLRQHDAIKIFDAAINKFPSYSLLYFNKGVAYLSMDSNAQAEQWFQKAILINPYMYSAHYQLGLAALRQGKLVPAFLSFIGYLLVNPGGKYESKAIALLSAISKSTDDILEFKNKRTISPDENYQAVEDILLSKIALDKAYKPIIALDDPISRQIQAVFEKLEYKESSSDFWIQYYLPFFKQTYTNGKFEIFINYIFSEVKIPEIQNYIKKRKKELENFVSDAITYFTLLRATRELYYTKREAAPERYLFEDGSLIGKGALSANGKSLKGKWYFYYPAGNIKGVGQFNDEGKRDGEFNFYYNSGNLKAKEHYKNGKLEGEQDNYYENGVLSSHDSYVNGEMDGTAFTYYYEGARKTITQYKNGKIDGEEKEFYSNGGLFSINSYSNDVHIGTSKAFYKSGQLKETEQYENGKPDGLYKSYYEDGTVNVEGQNKKGKAEGEWKYYYNNGKLREKRNFVDDIQEGLYEEYYENGNLSSTYTAKKGKMSGDVIYKDKDGKLYAKYVFENGGIRSAKYFDKSNHELSSAENKNNSIDVISYTPDGFKKMHRHFNKNGNVDGRDTLFYPSGKIKEIDEYKNDVLNGLSISFYLNGNKKSEVKMTDGKEDGYYKGYYFNGQMQAEGWFVDDKSQGEWIYYNELGKLTTICNYLDGELNGYRTEYLPTGKKSLEQKYHRGWLEEMTQYDSLENIIAQDSFPQGKGKFMLLYGNKQKMAESNYVNGDFNGAYKTYYFDGSLESIQYYKDGLKDSTYTAFYYGGIKSAEGSFKYGKKDGLWKNYGEDGKLYSTAEYKDDDLNGIRKYYSPDGSTDFESTYKDDVRDGLGKKYDTQGTLCYQVLAEDDNVASYSYLGTDNKLLPAIIVPADKGSLKSFFPNGKLSRQCTYSDGKTNGQDIIYYINGQIRSVDTSSYGIIEGISNEYYEDGKLKSSFNYLHDNVNGVAKEFYKNGTLKKEMNFLNGVSHGLTKYYDDKGELIKTMTYYYGKLIFVKNEK